MTVGELIQELKYMDEGATVRFASQPGWPFEYSIYGVIQVTVNKPGEYTNDGYKQEDVVYLEEGQQIGYLPKEAKEELGW
tara:strand:+ start:49 stop:288 length:240 start_codon:yes stop_codon:yes gene_type:complete